jgi:hypothetical protein
VVSFAAMPRGAQPVALAVAALIAPSLPSTAEPGLPSPQSWLVDYVGYGRVAQSGLRGLVLEPKGTVGCGAGHAALARMRESVDQPVKDFRLTFRAVAEQQLRRGARPNPWESLWLFFNYTGAPADKRTNYIAFKTNRLEIGRAWGSTAQRFLVTEQGPPTPLGREITVSVTKVGQQLTVTVDGEVVVRYDGGAHGGLYDHPGSIGFYTEEARVRVFWAELEPLKDDRAAVTP